MTLQTMLETIRATFPDKQEAQVKLDLNAAYAQYGEESRLPFQDFQVVVNAGVLAIGSTPLTQAYSWYSLPAPAKEILIVAAYDVNNNVVDVPDYSISFVGNMFQILDLHDSLYLGGGFPVGIARLRFRCSVIITPLSADSDVPAYPAQFHQGLVDHVYAKYYALKGVLQNAGWFKSSYASYVAAGKRYFNANIQ
jgi:hypothetical protein